MDEKELKEPLFTSPEDEHKEDEQVRYSPKLRPFQPTEPGAPGVTEEQPKPTVTTIDFEEKNAFLPPNVHPTAEMPSPYAVPQYESTHFNNEKEGMLTNRRFPFLNNPQFKVFVSALYVVVAVLMMIQGFGIFTNGGLTNFLLGLYSMGFGAVAIMYDLHMTFAGIEIEAWFPFLGNFFGRSMTVLFFATLAELSGYAPTWNSLIKLLDLGVAFLYGFMYLASQFAEISTGSQEEDVYRDL